MSAILIPPKQIDTIHLIPYLDELLLAFLESLSEKEWEKETIVPDWRVKDIAAHLLDGNLRSLSMLRDNYAGKREVIINSYEDLVSHLNNLNAEWVGATDRLSPNVIIDLLRISGKQYYEHLKSLDFNQTSQFSVAWAGEKESKNWFHIAREYTEKWHHQQQIRVAIGDEETLLASKWFQPYLNTSVRALPYHYRNTDGQKDDVIEFRFTGMGDASWHLVFEDNWSLYANCSLPPTCEVEILDKVAWRVFSKGISREKAISESRIIGDKRLGLPIFDMLAVMA